MKKKLLLITLVVSLIINAVPVTARADINTYEQKTSVEKTIPSIEDFPSGHISKYEEIPSSYIPEDYIENVDEPSVDADGYANETLGSEVNSSATKYIQESTNTHAQLGGTCWAEASVAMMETNLYKKGYIEKDELMSTDSIVLNFSYGFEDKLGNYRSNKRKNGTIQQVYNKGGLEDDAFVVMSVYRGVTYDSDINLSQYNYVKGAVTGEVYYDPEGWKRIKNMYEITDDETLAKSVFHLNSYVKIECYNPFDMQTSNSRIERSGITNINDIKQLILDNGAVTTAFDQTDAKVAYNGENEPPSITTMGYITQFADHAVCIVGWDDNYNKNRDKYSDVSEEKVTNGAWLIKQSYGDELAYKDVKTGKTKINRTGYMWLPYNEGSMRFQYLYSADFDKADIYTNQYCYNYDGAFRNVYDDYDKPYNCSVLMFTANGNPDGKMESIDGVMVGAKGGSDYRVSIWLNPEVVNGKLTGVKVKEKGGKFPYRDSMYGLFTVDLKDVGETALVEQGQKFAVVLETDEVTTEGTIERNDVFYYGHNLNSLTNDEYSGGFQCPSLRALTNPSSDTIINAKSITLSDKVLNLKEDEGKTLKAKIEPCNATYQKFSYLSTNSNVATVDDNGFVQAKRYGTTTIRVTSQDGKAVAECVVNVGAYSMGLDLKEKDSSYGLWKTDGELPLENGGVLKPVFKLKGLDAKNVTYTSSDNSIATVDEDGNIIPIKEGSCEIRVALYAKNNYGNPQNIVCSKTITIKRRFKTTPNGEDTTTPKTEEKTDDPSVIPETGTEKESEKSDETDKNEEVTETSTDNTSDTNSDSETDTPKSDEGKKTETNPVIYSTGIESKSDDYDDFTYQGVNYTFDDKNRVWVNGADKKVKKVVIPDSVIYKNRSYEVYGICEDAFYQMKTLESVSIGDNVIVIEEFAFDGCKNLVSVKIGKKVKTIKENAFSNCKKLKKITLPSEVKSIGNYAFGFDKNLKTVVIKSKVLKTVKKNAFYGIKKNATIKVPKSKKETYKKKIKNTSIVIK